MRVDNRTYKKKLREIRLGSKNKKQPKLILGKSEKEYKKEPAKENITFEESVLEKWIYENVSYLDELDSYAEYRMLEALNEFIEGEYILFVFEVYLGRSPQTDMRTYEFIGAESYLKEEEYKQSCYTKWQYSQVAIRREFLLQELEIIANQ